MKEVKHFFGNDNKLNKGYAKLSNSRELDNDFYPKKFMQMLPHIDVINQYESIYPGTLSTLIKMAEDEQHHRHAIDLINIEVYNRATTMGRIFGLIYVALVCITTAGLIVLDKNLGAITFASLAFLTVIVTSLSMQRMSRRKENKNAHSHLKNRK